MRTNVLHRKQYLISDKNLRKLNAIKKVQGGSSAEIVRAAISAYDPFVSQVKTITPEAINFLSGKISTAIAETKKTNEKIEAILARMEV